MLQPPPEEALEALQSFAAWAWAQVPPKSAAMPVAWRRDGLGVCFQRLEQLKMESTAVTHLLEETHRWLSFVRKQKAAWREAMDDKMADGIEQRAQSMSTRGMASEERWLAHRNRAISEFVWVRRFEEALVELEALRDLLQTRNFAVRDESMAIQAQFRAINLGIEISEL